MATILMSLIAPGRPKKEGCEFGDTADLVANRRRLRLDNRAVGPVAHDLALGLVRQPRSCQPRCPDLLEYDLGLGLVPVDGGRLGDLGLALLSVEDVHAIFHLSGPRTTAAGALSTSTDGNEDKELECF